MIKKLRRRFIYISMGSLLAVLLLVLGLINLVTSSFMTYAVLSRLDFVSEYEKNLEAGLSANLGTIQHKMINREFPYEARYFIVHITAGGKIGHTKLKHIAAVDKEEAKRLARLALSQDRNNGRIQTEFASYIYRVQSVGKSKKRKILVFLDVTRELQIMRMVLLSSFEIGSMIYLLVFVLVAFFSKRAIAPIAENYEKQKAFITNAGHELKTPLTIISANAEVLEMMYGENEWTQSITRQSKRMTDLVNNLVRLARMEEKDQQILYEALSLSALAEESADAFDTLIQSNGCVLVRKVEEGVVVKSDRRLLRELLSILLDNAAKYCDPEGTVEISLKSLPGIRSASLAVSNHYQEGEHVDFSRFFDRFYRADESHNSGKGGFGIGLSMADVIASALGAKLSVSWKEGVIRFEVLLSPLIPSLPNPS